MWNMNKFTVRLWASEWDTKHGAKGCWRTRGAGLLTADLDDSMASHVVIRVGDIQSGCAASRKWWSVWEVCIPWPRLQLLLQLLLLQQFCQNETGNIKISLRFSAKSDKWLVYSKTYSRGNGLPGDSVTDHFLLAKNNIYHDDSTPASRGCLSCSSGRFSINTATLR